MPNSKLVVLKATGHCPNLSAPEEVISAMRDFVSA
jgi:sigma-B regulation protein RsbQ